jgi:NADH-quinone oxidoreductase subunit G
MSEVTLTIDGQEITVEKGTTLIEAAKKVHVEVPHYCYHPGLSVDGNCRMCLVEVDKFNKPLIACKTEATEGMVVKTQTDSVKDMRQSVMEFLLINHPLDCPTCDQAGECRLQDYYMKYDVKPSRFEEEKVHKNKMVDLGANVMLDQERCIACTRCIRVCQEVAKEDELALANRGDHVMITTFPGKPLSNPYAGNTVDVCPVGALTNKEFRFKKRVWFLETTSSVCNGCSRGCNIYIEQEDRKIYRYRPRHNEEVNKYWMCDEGRYSYHEVNENRLLRSQINIGETLSQVSFEEAVEVLASELKSADTSKVAVIGHAGETYETLSALKDFANNTLKTSHLHASKKVVENPSFDDILRTKDKNPNQKSVDELGFKSVSEISNPEFAIVVNGLSDEDHQILKDKNISILALFTSHETKLIDEAKINIAIPTFAEQDGHFINVDGIKQEIKKAINAEAIII